MKRIIPKQFYKQPLFYLSLVFLLAVLGVIVSLLARIHAPLTQTVNLCGYQLRIPNGWMQETRGNTVLFYDYANDAPLGEARVFHQALEAEHFPDCFPFETQPISERNSKFQGLSLCSQQYLSDMGRFTAYVLSDLPNPQPYHITLYFDVQRVKSSLAKDILKSFLIPDPGKNPPPKNLTAPTEEEAKEIGALYTLKTTDQTFVHNVAQTDVFSQAKASGEPSQLTLLAYHDAGEGLTLDLWYFLDFDGERTLLYSYYQGEDGSYSYDNNPARVDGIEFVTDDESGMTYCRAPRASDAPIVLLEYPLNPYLTEDNLLMEHAGTQADDAEAVGAILDLLPTPGLTRKDFSLQTKQSPYGLTIVYQVEKEDLACKDDGKLNRSPLEKNAALLFSLIENVDRLTMKIEHNGKTELANYSREKTEKFFDGDVRNLPKEAQTFKQYLEDVQNMPAVAEEKPGGSLGISESGGVLGEVVYSGSIVIPRGMLVTHPRTGEKVVIDPYAESHGYGGVLGKPISCTIYRTANGYRAVASCGGRVLLSQNLASEAEKNNAIATIHAYGG